MIEFDAERLGRRAERVACTGRDRGTAHEDLDLDAARDRAVGRTDKPVARGDVSERVAWVAASGCLVIALALSAPLGWRMLAAHALMLCLEEDVNVRFARP